MADYRGGFADLTEEVTDRMLDVDGEIPAWLSGRLLRNGPARWSTETAVADHWFDGLAHLTRFEFESGAVRYSNRFLRTDAYREAVDEGSFGGQFATSEGYLSRLKTLLSGESTDNANVHVARFDGQYLALTETPNWVAFDPETLVSEGTVAFEDDLSPHHITAHLRRDDATGKTWGYFVQFGRRNEYVVFRVPHGTLRREAVARVEVDRPAYMHSFALTASHVVLVEPPLVTHPVRFLLPGNGGFIDNYDWEPHRGTRFFVFDRDTGRLIDRVRASPFFTFHTANAFDASERGTGEEDEGVVVDLVAYDDASPVTDLSMRDLRRGVTGFPTGQLRRYRLSLDGSVEWEPITEDVEMPQFSHEVHMEPYQYVFAQSTDVADGNALTRVDVETGHQQWWADPGVFTGEPVFVPRPEGSRGDVEPDPDGETQADDETDGVVLSLCLDTDADQSFLAVLDGDLTELARAPLPHVVPFGFHGAFFAPDEE